MQYHQNISMPNHTVLLESCKEYYIHTYLEHCYTNIQLYTIDAQQFPPHAVSSQEDQQVQIVPGVPPMAPAYPDEVQPHWQEAVDSNLDKTNQIIRSSRPSPDQNLTDRLHSASPSTCSSTYPPRRHHLLLFHVQLFSCPSHWPICSPHIANFHFIVPLDFPHHVNRCSASTRSSSTPVTKANPKLSAPITQAKSNQYHQHSTPTTPA